MLSVRPQQKIVEKILQTKGGGFVRAQFLLTEYQGRIHIKLISAEPISEQEGGTFSVPSTLALPVAITIGTFERVLNYGETIVSTFTDFSFFTSQPTRAPASRI